ncbi:ADP-ribosylation factor-like protein 13B isoform X2 [Rhodnius prolixus]|uniref:ADP-ribosylation factor-like protein 13B isoform X2 n=1 Tax=Rhodnius prolixus TaxID=13249 RepID=UPI003D18B85B
MGSCCCKQRIIRGDSQKKIALLLVGLDNSGKTTTARGLAGDVVESTIPTVGFSAIKPKTKGYDVTVFDLGGGVQIRDIWESYFHFVHGVIYVVDASDLSRIEESKTVLENLLLNEKLAGKPVLVLANKQDKPYALDEIDIVEVLQLEPLVNQQKCHTLVKVCSAVPATPKKKKIDKRLISGYRWLLSQILKEYDILNDRVECDSRMETERFEARRALQRKKFEEFTEETQLSNGASTVSNHAGTNGVSSESSTIEYVPKTITSNIRDQLEEKIDRQKFPLSIGRRNNKVHPVNVQSMDQLPDLTQKATKRNLYTSVETSMTLRALTSPLHGGNHARHSDSSRKHSPIGRPLTSRSLGNEVGAWGLDRELDIIYPTQVTRHLVTEDGVKDEILIEYLRKD